MGVDIAIAVVAFVAQCALVYVAWRATVEPIDSADKARRGTYEAIIWISFSVGLITIVATGIRGGDVRGELEALKEGQDTANTGIGLIRETLGTSTAKEVPPSSPMPLPAKERARLHVLSFEILPPAVGAPVQTNVFVSNTGKRAAEQTRSYYIVAVVKSTEDISRRAKI